MACFTVLQTKTGVERLMMRLVGNVSDNPKKKLLHNLNFVPNVITINTVTLTNLVIPKNDKTTIQKSLYNKIENDNWTLRSKILSCDLILWKEE